MVNLLHFCIVLKVIRQQDKSELVFLYLYTYLYYTYFQKWLELFFNSFHLMVLIQI